MAKKSKAKVIAKTDVASKSNPERIAFFNAAYNTCQQSDAYKGSKTCQEAMAAWKDKTKNLDDNQQAIKTLLDQIGVLRDAEIVCVREYNESAATFGLASQTVAKNDPSIIIGMGLFLKSEPTKPGDPTVVQGVSITTVKKGNRPKLEWDVVPGAVLYKAQISPEPANDNSWADLFG